MLEPLEPQGLTGQSGDTHGVFRTVPPDLVLLPHVQHTADAPSRGTDGGGPTPEARRETGRRHDAGQLPEAITRAETL
ncbi:hypothetical protein AB0N06_23265 [Streptomyces sp. NPDC051020]|uniref:hypothetical protein n=1 Tax=Streptomyces sp. NPDC051020 TaxID=3155409 RepID=UPI003423C8ED